ncbi:mitotic spindle assembly hypothetical protein [Limosa lapponica baueri]|uniref:Uncharacterized protein n=1 Tax=Limosa lapponica baueri TaxID=1758121 RepID=A0A2I0TBR8_LIMLA|nr:mitotic spindle assembly hypothetical protein [Limosa lapponica baueri]
MLLLGTADHIKPQFYFYFIRKRLKDTVEPEIVRRLLKTRCLLKSKLVDFETEMRLFKCFVYVRFHARILEKARQQLQEEILRIQSQLLDEKKKREQHEALVRRLQKRVLLLTKDISKKSALSYIRKFYMTCGSPKMKNLFGKSLSERKQLIESVFNGKKALVCLFQEAQMDLLQEK